MKQYTDEEKTAIGLKLIEIFLIARTGPPDTKQDQRYQLGAGYATKTARGVFEVVKDLGERIEKGDI